jgi:hypothetical protein
MDFEVLGVIRKHDNERFIQTIFHVGISNPLRKSLTFSFQESQKGVGID